VSRRLVKLYHALPPWTWSAAASFRAWQQRARRYGPIYRRALPAIRERVCWDSSRYLDFQRRQLAELLNRAAVAVPAYRGCPEPDAADPLKVMTRWPLVDIERFRQRPDDYLDPAYASNGIVLYTSGSTGTPKKIVRDSRAEQLNYAYAEARWRNSAGVKFGDRWAMVGGQLVVPANRARPPFWVKAYPMGQLYMSSYHLQPEFADDYMRALVAWRPAYILGYASSLNILAEFAERTGLRPELRCILSNAEPLYTHVRERLERVFGCRVRDTYGATEGAFIGFECEAGRMHISPDVGVFEILDDDGKPCPPGKIGRAVVTGLTNRAMPLIRYPTGDLVSWAAPSPCECGCSFPVLERIEGRHDEVLVLPNGRRIGRLDPVFKGGFPMREAQIVQRRDGVIEVRIVPDRHGDGHSRWDERQSRHLLGELGARLGSGVTVRIEITDRIPRDRSGKFKAVVREGGDS